MYLPPGSLQLFGAACFWFGVMMLIRFRKTLGKLRVLFLPFLFSSLAFLTYFLRNVIEIPFPLSLTDNILTFLMWGSWLWTVVHILRAVENREDLI